MLIGHCRGHLLIDSPNHDAYWSLQRPPPNRLTESRCLLVIAEAISQSTHRITGSIQMGTQAHFHLELQTSRCAPDDDGGMDVQTTTQWINASAEIIAGVLNIPQSA